MATIVHGLFLQLISSELPERRTATAKTAKKSFLCPYKYVICGGNAAPVVDGILQKWGWTKTDDKDQEKSRPPFTLMWTELKYSINFQSFREGEQLVNHFPNITMLTTKIGLLESLRMCRPQLQALRLELNSVIPQTFRLDVATERAEFEQIYQVGEQWICKPTGANQGKGIFLVESLEHLRDRLAKDEAKCKISYRPAARIVQRYLSQPLLLDGKKFDIRVYMLLVAAERGQILAFYREGYVRRACLPYDKNSEDMTVHLTNQYVQKKHPTYSDVKEETVWDFPRLQTCLSDNGMASDWVASDLTLQMQRVMLGCYYSVQQRLQHKIGYFELLGFDFMLDSSYHLWLIEVNINPAMHTNCNTLQQIVPATLEETLELAIEIWSKSRRSKPLFPLKAKKSFVTLFPT